MNIKYIFFIFIVLCNCNSWANTSVSPCTNDIRTISINDDIARIEISMTPFRGVNLIFPFDIRNDQALYSISSDKVFDFEKSNDTNLVPLYFKSFDSSWFGTSADFTIAYDNLVFSFLITAAKEGHCSNYKILLSEPFKKRLEAQKEAKKASLNSNFSSSNQDYIDEEINHQLLTKLAGIVKGKHTKIRIHEESKLTVSEGEHITLYLKDIETFSSFSIISAVVENKTNVSSPLIIRSFTVSGKSSIDRMSSQFEAKMESNTEQDVVITTLGDLPKTGGTLNMITNFGKVEVKW